MQIIKLCVNFNTSWGQDIYVCGSTREMGRWIEADALPLICTSPSEWSLEIILFNPIKEIQYYYFIKENQEILRKEWGTHLLRIEENKKYFIKDFWQDIPNQRYLYTTAFSSVFFKSQTDGEI